jgi:UDP-N-acetylmuramoyl-tripeptide--D-alanyl-D-alanine ligase
LPAVAVAVSLARKLELNDAEIADGIEKLQPLHGRMNPLRARKGSLVIDDTYNSSPEAAIAALETLYEIKSKHKIAVLGQMNELGKYSQILHQQVGDHCDSTQLDLVITVGKDANSYLAAAAKKQGCKIVRCPTPYHAADILLPLIHKDTVLLAKGSQNNVYLEEAVKLLLMNPSDNAKLVRQSRNWIKKKDECFNVKVQ